MRKLYPYLTSTLFLLLAISSLQSVKAQNCGPIVENFDLAGGTNGGFTSSIHMNPDPATGLVFGFNGQDGYLQRCETTAGTVYEVVTPVYQSSPAATSITYGFELSGSVAATQVGVFIEYFNTVTGMMTTTFVANLSPVYTPPPGNQAALICESLLMSTLEGFTPGDSYRFHFLLTAGSSSNNNQCMVFDDFRTEGVVTPTPINPVPVCGPIQENFNNTGGSTAGFSSSTQGDPASPGFTYDQTGQDGFLERCNTTAGAVYQIHSPSYQTAVSQTFVGYGFELTGSVPASEANIFIEYVHSGTGTITTAYVGTHYPVYTGTGNNTIARVCDSVLISAIPGFTPGGTYRIYVLLTAGASSNNNQCIEFDDFRTTGFVALIPLPVTFTQFTGKNTNQSVVLNWTVAGEKDVLKYIIERSTNGRDFTRIGEVAASGNSVYSYTDQNLSQGVYFYRLRNEDVDGQYKFSTILRFNLGKVIAIRAFPQPAFNQLTVEHSAVENAGVIAILNANGQLIREIKVQPNLTQTQINLSGVNSGLYILRFDNGKGTVETIKIVKQ